MHTEVAKSSIEGFSTKETAYTLLRDTTDMTGRGYIDIAKNGEANKVFIKKNVLQARIDITFAGARNCKVFINSGIAGNLKISITNDDSVIYIGNDARFIDLEIRSRQKHDFIAIGNGVTTTGGNLWISGQGAGKSNPALIIGDDCMFSRNVVIRNSDAHPVFDLSTDEQINEPAGSVHFEPHVWIGERVGILKSVTVGACSILALGCVVTKDIPRFSRASGIPAFAYDLDNVYWSRDSSKKSRDKAKAFLHKYKNS